MKLDRNILEALKTFNAAQLRKIVKDIVEDEDILNDLNFFFNNPQVAAIFRSKMKWSQIYDLIHNVDYTTVQMFNLTREQQLEFVGGGRWHRITYLRKPHTDVVIEACKNNKKLIEYLWEGKRITIEQLIAACKAIPNLENRLGEIPEKLQEALWDSK